MQVNKVLRSFQFLSILILFLVVFLNCSEQKSKNKADSLQDQNIKMGKEKIRATLIEMWDAIEKEDIEKYASFVHPDFTQFGETDTLLRIGKDNEIKGVKEWIDSSKGIHTEMIDQKVTIKGNVSWITYYWSDHGITNGEKFASRGKSTRIFVKEDNKWLCIHGHYTLLPKQLTRIRCKLLTQL